MKDLHPIDQSSGIHVPFSAGERVAFREDHADHGSAKDENGDITYPAKYGLIQAVGLDETGRFSFDAVVVDPFDGKMESKPRRFTLEDIQ